MKILTIKSIPITDLNIPLRESARSTGNSLSNPLVSCAVTGDAISSPVRHSVRANKLCFIGVGFSITRYNKTNTVQNIYFIINALTSSYDSVTFLGRE
jgi:hypothetical protein